MPSLAVVLCTFNGDAYLAEQLRSIEQQTRLPDEIVVRDDCSTDQTIDILQTFRESSSIPMRITQNDDRAGVSQNFQRAISDTKCDLISLSDQDDIWLPHKLKSLGQLLEENESASAACGDAQLVDDTGVQLEHTVWSFTKFTADDRRNMRTVGAFGPLLRTNVIPGATIVFRRKYRDLILPFSNFGFYDHWMAILLQAVSHLAFATDIVQLYRMHQSNAVGLRRPDISLTRDARERRRSVRIDSAHFNQDVLTRLRTSNQFHTSTSTLDQLGRWEAFAQWRAELDSRWSKRALPTLKRAAHGDYGDYSHGWRSAGYDILLA